MAHRRPCSCCGGSPGCGCANPCQEVESFDYYITRDGNPNGCPTPPGVIHRPLTAETYCCNYLASQRVTLFERLRSTLFYDIGGSCLYEDETRTFDGAPVGTVNIDRHLVLKNPYTGCSAVSDVTSTIPVSSSCNIPYEGSMFPGFARLWPSGLENFGCAWGWAWCTKSAHAGELFSRERDAFNLGWVVKHRQWAYTREDDCSPPECIAEACCLPDGGGCVDLLPADCLAAGGIPQGSGTSCGGPATGIVECSPPIPSGACCHDGSCSVETESGCSDLGGEYLGDGSTCDADGACPELGACCDTTTGECADGVAELDCTSNWYPGQLCMTVPCEADVNGACCKPDGSCENTTGSACFALGGSFQEGITCDFAACEDYGACCCPDGAGGTYCTMVFAGECDAGGVIDAVGCVFFPGGMCIDGTCVPAEGGGDEAAPSDPGSAGFL